MEISKTFCLKEAKICFSPNCSERTSDEISLLVIHNISLPPGEYGGGFVEKLFTNQLDPTDHPYFSEVSNLEVSSHLLIERDGSITQFVPFNLKAWHAGVSFWKGKSSLNKNSIGIELVNKAKETKLYKIVLEKFPDANLVNVISKDQPKDK